MTGDDAAPATFGSLFARKPERWGLRGDPHLWRELREVYADTPMPNDWFDVNRLLEKGFEQLTGEKLRQYAEPVYIKRFSIGSGMSDGAVNTNWWATIGEALLVDRWAAANPEQANRFELEAEEPRDP